MLRYGLSSVALAALASAAAAANPGTDGSSFSGSGFLTGEVRAYPDDPEWPGQDDARFAPSVFGQLELAFNWDGDRQKITITPFGRLDALDENRTHVHAGAMPSRQEFFWAGRKLLKIQRFATRSAKC